MTHAGSLLCRKKRVHGDEEEEEGEESPEQLRQKVWQLQEYVRELTKYYGELMEAFEELKGRQGGDSVSLFNHLSLSFAPSVCVCVCER